MNGKVKTILISPHSDDIAYSLGGTLLTEYLSSPMMLVTVFTKSNFSRRVKLSDPKEITKIRTLEDAKFAEEIRIEYKGLNFPESPLRGKITYEEIFGNSDPYSDPIYREVYVSLSKLLKEFPDALVISPMSIGNHLDHRIVLESCLAICKENNIKILFYEDLPYASLFTLKQIEDKAFKIDPNLKPYKIDITSVLRRKLDNLKIYKTQTGKEIPREVIIHAAHIGINNEKFIETIWRSDLFKNYFYWYNRIRGNIFFERVWK